MSDSAITSLATPRDWWEMLNAEFHFTLDVAADHEQFMCVPYYTAEQDALKQPWGGVVWCSPPWHTVVLKHWVKKGYEESAKRGSTVVMLLPIQHYESWWFEYALKAKEIRFIDGCLDFTPFGGNHNGGFAVEPHCLTIFAPHQGQTIISAYPSHTPEKPETPNVQMKMIDRTW